MGQAAGMSQAFQVDRTHATVALLQPHTCFHGGYTTTASAATATLAAAATGGTQLL